MVIDALRTDFVQAGNIMTRLRTMIADRQACMFHLKVESPTVTMPRLKVSTTACDISIAASKPKQKIIVDIGNHLRHNTEFH